jgi:CBS domain-containing protein
MTPEVVSVGPDSTVREVADILMTRGISAVPVIDGERLVGIVSEGDLIRRAEIGTAEVRHRSWWLRLFEGNSALAAAYVRTHSERVRDVMTRDVITVAEDTPLSEVAALLEDNRIKRVPVLREGRPVGIVSRANLIRALAAAKARPVAPAAAGDGAIRTKVLEVLGAQPWSEIDRANVTVTDGLVEFWGIYSSEEARQATRVVAENIPGVQRVEDHRLEMSFVPYGGV